MCVSPIKSNSILLVKGNPQGIQYIACWSEHIKYSNKKVQWLRGLAAVAMLSARIWVRVPPKANGVFRLKRGFSTQQSNPNSNLYSMCPNYIAWGYQGLHIKQANKKALAMRKLPLLLEVEPHLQRWESTTLTTTRIPIYFTETQSETN